MRLHAHEYFSPGTGCLSLQTLCSPATVYTISFFSFFLFFHCVGKMLDIIQGTALRIWLSNCTRARITHWVTSPRLWCPQMPPTLFSLPLSGGRNTYESSAAWGHALLIAHLNEVIHNVAALYNAHTHTHTLSSVCPRTRREAVSVGTGPVEKVNVEG